MKGDGLKVILASLLVNPPHVALHVIPSHGAERAEEAEKLLSAHLVLARQVSPQRGFGSERVDAFRAAKASFRRFVDAADVTEQFHGAEISFAANVALHRFLGTDRFPGRNTSTGLLRLNVTNRFLGSDPVMASAGLR